MNWKIKIKYKAKMKYKIKEKPDYITVVQPVTDFDYKGITVTHASLKPAFLISFNKLSASLR